VRSSHSSKPAFVFVQALGYRTARLLQDLVGAVAVFFGDGVQQFGELVHAGSGSEVVVQFFGSTALRELGVQTAESEHQVVHDHALALDNGRSSHAW